MKLKQSFYEDLKIGSKNLKAKRWTTENEKNFLLAQLSFNPETNILEKIYETLLYPNIENRPFLTSTEKEYALVELRARSVGEKFKGSFVCSKCETKNETEFNIKEITTYKEASWKPVELEIGEEKVLFSFRGIQNETAQAKIDSFDNAIEKTYCALLLSISKVQIDEEEYDDFTYESLDELIKSLPVNDFDKLIKEFGNMQESLSFEAKDCKCAKCKGKTDVVFEEIPDFLPW